MNVLLSLTFAVVPALLIILYFLRKDRARPEPRRQIIKIFFLGLFSTVPAVLLELGVGEFGRFLRGYPELLPVFKAFIVAAMVEESLKFFIVKRIAFKKASFDEVMDGIVYAVMAGMGFACLENVLYVLGRGLTVALMRAVTSIPLHASVSVIMGYYIGIARFTQQKSSRRRLLWKGYLIAILFHGLYDLSIFAIPYWSQFTLLGLPPVLIWVIILARKKVKAALELDAKAGRIPGTG